jgi:hypothetical protein
MPTNRGSSRSTVGNHFSSLLVSSHQAWLDYHGDPKQKAKPPNYVCKLQQEGLDHEWKVFETHYPNATQFRESCTDTERAIRCLDLINVLNVAERGSAEPNNSDERVSRLRSVINWLVGPGGWAA